MESKTKRTLVKSAPELWELADDLARMEAWMAGLVGAARRSRSRSPTASPERMLAWRTSGAKLERARIALELAAEGFGNGRRRSPPSTRGPTWRRDTAGARSSMSSDARTTALHPRLTTAGLASTSSAAAP